MVIIIIYLSNIHKVVYIKKTRSRRKRRGKLYKRGSSLSVISKKIYIAVNTPGMVASMHESYKPEFWFGSQVSGQIDTESMIEVISFCVRFDSSLPALISRHSFKRITFHSSS